MNPRDADHRVQQLAPDAAIMTIALELCLHKHCLVLLVWKRAPLEVLTPLSGTTGGDETVLHALLGRVMVVLLCKLLVAACTVQWCHITDVFLCTLGCIQPEN